MTPRPATAGRRFERDLGCPRRKRKLSKCERLSATLHRLFHSLFCIFEAKNEI